MPENQARVGRRRRPPDGDGGPSQRAWDCHLLEVIVSARILEEDPGWRQG